ncbi:hypothetical protein, partial [Spiroplasma endosymbiont of Amphibalanus improvisus]|uniref:hypothetical protein n=1 Tax=Spiroplasma endosymbiont of Amphibalanus improvisus TaxID=3066327 RepID=UPI00313B9154
MKVKVKDLYGIKNEIILDFSKKYNVVFAPNGSGKTSIVNGFKCKNNNSECKISIDGRGINESISLEKIDFKPNNNFYILESQTLNNCFDINDENISKKILRMIEQEYSKKNKKFDEFKEWLTLQSKIFKDTESSVGQHLKHTFLGYNDSFIFNYKNNILIGKISSLRIDYENLHNNNIEDILFWKRKIFNDVVIPIKYGDLDTYSEKNKIKYLDDVVKFWFFINLNFNIDSEELFFNFIRNDKISVYDIFFTKNSLFPNFIKEYNDDVSELKLNPDVKNFNFINKDSFNILKKYLQIKEKFLDEKNINISEYKVLVNQIRWMFEDKSFELDADAFIIFLKNNKSNNDYKKMTSDLITTKKFYLKKYNNVFEEIKNKITNIKTLKWKIDIEINKKNNLPSLHFLNWNKTVTKEKFLNYASEGQKNIIAIILSFIFANDKKWLIIDDVFSSFDLDNIQIIVNQLNSFEKNVIIFTHNYYIFTNIIFNITKNINSFIMDSFDENTVFIFRLSKKDVNKLKYTKDIIKKFSEHINLEERSLIGATIIYELFNHVTYFDLFDDTKIDELNEALNIYRH